MKCRSSGLCASRSGNRELVAHSTIDITQKMSREANQLWECNYCSAFFATSVLLETHLQYFRVRATSGGPTDLTSSSLGFLNSKNAGRMRTQTPKILDMVQTANVKIYIQ